MAEIVLGALVNKVTDIAGNLIVQGNSRLSWLQEDINWMEREMRHIRSYLKDAKAKRATSHGIANLVTDIEELALDIDDILDTFLPQIESSKSKKGPFVCVADDGCLKSHTGATLQFAKEMEKIRRRVEDIERIRRTYEIADTRSNKSDGDNWDPRASFLREDETVVGFEEDIGSLAAKLLNEDHGCSSIISIVGMPGLGKTTLAKRVFRSTRHRFQCSALVYVSQQPNIKSLLQEIAEQVGLEEERKENNLAENLCSFLVAKRYLIFLDDIWNISTWDALKIGIPCNFGNGSRIIITSRNTGVGRYIGGESSLYELRPLDQEKSWKLFSTLIMTLPETNNGRHDPPELEDIGKKMVRKCGGVPLAIVVTVGMLKERERTEHEWKWVLKSMGKDGEDDCSKIIALSYEDLPTRVKPCFLYFGHFPEDHEIHALQIINMWIAEKFIQVNGIHEPEEVGEEYLNKLVLRNLIQIAKRKSDGRIKSCRIHDLLHTFCISKSKESNFSYTPDNLVKVNRVRRISIQSGNIKQYLASGYQTPKLRSLLCFDEHQELSWRGFNISLAGFKFLSVLNIDSQVFLRCIPREITSLSHLHYLRWKTIHTRIPSSIINLRNLQTFELELSISNCSAKFPGCLWRMKKLRHFILRNGWCTFTHPPAVCMIRKYNKLSAGEASWPSLQTLFWINGNHMSASWLSHFPNLKKVGIMNPSEEIMKLLSNVLSPTFPKLEKLMLSATSVLVSGVSCCLYKDVNLSCYHNISKLLLCLPMKKLPKLDEFPPNLIKLQLHNNDLEEDPMPTLKKLPKLKILMLGFHFCNLAARKWLDFTGTDSFPQLEELRIGNLWPLKIIATDEGMPKLKKVTISDSMLELPQRFEKLRMTSQ